MILSVLPVGAFLANCYIVGSEKTGEALIIDPGGDTDEILTEIATLRLSVKVIVLTHAHMDHVGALKEVRDATAASVAIHEGDAPALTRDSVSRSFGFSYPTPPPPDRLLHDGDEIKIGELSFTVIHTPGHSPGSICLLGEGLLFSGDTLFCQSIGRTDLAGGGYDQIMNSLQNKLMKLPPDTAVFPGHGPDTTIGREKKENPFLRS